MSTFDETLHPRGQAGQFTTKANDAPAAALNPGWWGYDDERVRETYRGDRSAALALRMRELLPGSEIVSLTTGNGTWAHSALRLPNGVVVDGEGASDGGGHILDNDYLYGLFDDEDLASSDGEVFITPAADWVLHVGAEASKIDPAEITVDAARVAEWARGLDLTRR